MKTLAGHSDVPRRPVAAFQLQGVFVQGSYFRKALQHRFAGLDIDAEVDKMDVILKVLGRSISEEFQGR
jgi:hypothetical protein